MKYSEDIKLEIGGKFLNGDYHKDLKQLTKDLDRLIKSAKSEQLKLYDVVGRSEQLPSKEDVYSEIKRVTELYYNDDNVRKSAFGLGFSTGVNFVNKDILK